MASGQLPVMRIGRSVRVPAKGFQEWLETRVAATTAEPPRGAVGDDEAGRFVWCVDPEAAVAPDRDGAAPRLAVTAVHAQGEPVTHD